MESWFKVDSRLVIQNPANWSKSPLGVFSELTREALMMFLFLKVAGNFQMTFHIDRDVLARVADFIGNDRAIDDILAELELYDLIQIHGEDFFVLTESRAARKAQALKEPVPTQETHTAPAVKEQGAKAYAGLCSYKELVKLASE